MAQRGKQHHTRTAWIKAGQCPGCSHFFEEVPVGDDLELLQDEEDATADEEGLVPGQCLVQQQQVALAGTTGDYVSPAPQARSPIASQGRDDTHLTALVTSANCMRWYFRSSSTVGMWPCRDKGGSPEWVWLYQGVRL